MKQTDIEIVYDAMALALDEAGTERQNLLLAKLVLLLSHDLGDTDLITKRIKEAGENLNSLSPRNHEPLKERGDVGIGV